MNDNETEKQITEIFMIKAYIDRKIKEGLKEERMEVVDNAEQIVKDYVDSEEFIDTIVTRIKNKQLWSRQHKDEFLRILKWTSRTLTGEDTNENDFLGWERLHIPVSPRGKKI